MATIDINGIACTFPKIPYGVLESWHVTSRTRYLAYKLSENPLHNSTIAAMLASAYEFGALARPPFWALDEDGRAAVLLENPSATVMDAITNWLTWTIGPNHTYQYPYQRALTGLRLKAEQEGEDIERQAEMMRYRREYQKTMGAGNPLTLPKSSRETDN